MERTRDSLGQKEFHLTKTRFLECTPRDSWRTQILPSQR